MQGVRPAFLRAYAADVAPAQEPAGDVESLRHEWDSLQAHATTAESKKDFADIRRLFGELTKKPDEVNLLAGLESAEILGKP